MALEREGNFSLRSPDEEAVRYTALLNDFIYISDIVNRTLSARLQEQGEFFLWSISAMKL